MIVLTLAMKLSAALSLTECTERLCIMGASKLGFGVKLLHIVAQRNNNAICSCMRQKMKMLTNHAIALGEMLSHNMKLGSLVLYCLE